MAERVGNLSLRTTSDSAKIALMASSSHRTTPGVGRTSPAPRQVAILAYPGVQSLDVTGPLEVLDGASRLIAATGRGEPAYEVRVYAPAHGPIQTSSGLTLVPDAVLGRSAAKLDTLIVAGGPGSR